MSTAKSAIMATLVLGIFSAHADAVLPADQRIKYSIRETPTDPESAVVFEVILHLSAYSSSGNSVKWSIDEAKFVRDAGQMRQPGADRRARLTMLGELRVRRHDQLWFPFGHSRQPLAATDTVGQLLAGHLLQPRFVVVEFDL